MNGFIPYGGTDDAISKQSTQDLSKEAIQYLSKEIETVTNNMMVFRTKIAFAVLIGPFLILGSFVVSARGYHIWMNPDGVAKIAIATDAFCYLALAVMSAMIEQAAWKKCNDWRKLIADLHKKPSVTISWERAQWKQNKMIWAYLGAYFLLILSFAAAIVVISRVNVVIPASNNSTSSRATSSSNRKALGPELVSANSQPAEC